MKRILLSFIMMLSVFFLSAQDLHTIQEILEIMEQSSLSYSISNGTEFDVPDYAENLISNDIYRVKEDGVHYEIKNYELSKEASGYFDDAEDFFQQKNYPAARKNYQKVLELCPTYYKAMVYIGDTYFHERDLDNAQEWYQRAIDNNYIDYLAHWALGNTLLFKEDFGKAMKEISIAKVLNRNNPRLTTKLQEIYKYNKKEYKDWYLRPLYKLDEAYDSKKEKDIIKVTYKDYWMPYALVKAVWAYEPGYAESMGPDNLGLLQEKEAIAAILVTMDKKLVKKDIALKTLQYAFDNKEYEMYVVFERLLPEMPQIPLYLEPDVIESIADYIVNTRCKVK